MGRFYPVGLRLLSALFLGALLANCARPGSDRLIPTAAPADAKIVRILVATTRARVEPDQNIFTSQRARSLNYAEFTVALPPAPAFAAASATSVSNDPLERFSTVDQAILTREQFNAQLASRRHGILKQRVYVFVHGYNNNFQESLYRIAQMAADTRVDGPVILFAWPSQARLTGYVADRDAVAYSRDYLAALLTDLAANPSVGRIGVLAHSMGGWLTMETLRELRLQGKTAVLSRLNVVLAAPDIDIDLFRQQLRVVGRLPHPLTLLVSKNDEALAVSSSLAGAKARVGNVDVNDPRVDEVARRADVRVIDISSLSTSDGLGHDRYVYAASLYPQLSASMKEKMQNAGAYVFNGASMMLEGPSQ